MSNPKPIVIETDVIVTHRGSEFVVAHREESEDGNLAVFAGKRLSENTFDSNWLFYISPGDERNAFNQGYYLSLLNEKFQEQFGPWETDAEPEAAWLKVARFLRSNLKFDPAVGFSL